MMRVTMKDVLLHSLMVVKSPGVAYSSLYSALAVIVGVRLSCQHADLEQQAYDRE